MTPRTLHRLRIILNFFMQQWVPSDLMYLFFLTSTFSLFPYFFLDPWSGSSYLLSEDISNPTSYSPLVWWSIKQHYLWNYYFAYNFLHQWWYKPLNFYVTLLDFFYSLVLGYNWLIQHNLLIDWVNMLINFYLSLQENLALS